MFLQVVGRKYVKQKNYRNIVLIISVIVWAIVGYYTVKRRSFYEIDKEEQRNDLIKNVSSFSISDATESELSDFLLNLETEYLSLEDYGENEPVNDILLIINIFLGIHDDVYNADSIWVIIFRFIGYCIFGWNMLRFCVWFDRIVDLWFDDRKMIKEIGDKDHARDFVLEYRKQMRSKISTGKPIEIRSFSSKSVDISRSFDHLSDRFLVPVKSISPAFLYPSIYALLLYFLTTLHTLLVEPHLFIKSLMHCSSYTTGLGPSMISISNSFKNYLLVFVGAITQIMLCATMWRMAQLIIEIYSYMIDMDERIKPICLGPITENLEKEENKEKKNN